MFCKEKLLLKFDWSNENKNQIAVECNEKIQIICKFGLFNRETWKLYEKLVKTFIFNIKSDGVTLRIQGHQATFFT